LIEAVARDLLGDFPRTRDLFDALHAQGTVVGTVVGRVLPGVMARAGAHWPPNPGDPEYRRTTNSQFLAGVAVSPGGPPAMCAAVSAYLAEKGWELIAADPREAGVPEGELILVHEMHGLALPSLSRLAEMKHAYDDAARDGRVAHCHLDVRLRPLLPDLAAADLAQVRDEVESRDLAMIAIVLGAVRWDAQRRGYQLRADAVRQADVGEDDESFARWLRSAGGRDYRDVVRGEVDGWFTGLLGRVPEGRDAGDSAARSLAALDLVLQLLAEKAFPPQRLADGESRCGPAHTMMRRLRRAYVDKHLKTLAGYHPGVNLERARAGVAPVLHRHVRFVGPSPRQTARAAEPAAPVSRRVLQLVAPADADGEAVLSEAYELGWYPGVRGREALTTLFPATGRTDTASP
jgi:hypothetical protein